MQTEGLKRVLRFNGLIFSWEPALETLNSRDDDDDDEEEVQKKALQFSAINSHF